MNEHSLYSGLTSDPCEEVIKWKHSFTCIVGRPSRSGKPSFVIKLIKHDDVMFTEILQSISWHYGEFQQLIIDDLKDEVEAKLFTKDSHHRNTSLLLLIQNIFHQNKHSRTVSPNSHYMVLFKNVRDASQITHLAKQMYPGNVNPESSYEDATNKLHGYLLIDLKPDTSDLLRLRTDIFPGEIHYVYKLHQQET